MSVTWNRDDVAEVDRPRAEGPASLRVPLTEWLFGGRFTDARATEKTFNDSGYDTVTVPHSVASLSWRDWDPTQWEQVWIYRRHFDVPAEFAGLRVFADFAGVMTGSTTWLNGKRLGEYRGGYLPFGYELTGQLGEQDNVLAVTVDGRFLPVPPNGHPGGTDQVDFLQPSGIYRDVTLRAVPQVFLSDLFARPVDVLHRNQRRVEVECTVDAAQAITGAARLDVELRDDSGAVLAAANVPVTVDKAGTQTVRCTLKNLGDILLWDVGQPNLYHVVAVLHAADEPLHEHRTRIGFREAHFAEDGFFLNGRRLKLFGVNRHQIYPYTAMAMPDRVQRRDAQILLDDLNSNMVRCAHYPQSTAFMDACDELGLLVFEEIPGWQYVGDDAWQQLVERDVEQMVIRDRNRPSVVVWGVRVNESGNFPALYTRTRDLAKRLDPSRQTTGAMLGSRYSTTDFVQDVFSYNDYTHTAEAATLRPPLPGIPFVVTEAIGSLAGPNFYRRTDTQAVQARQAFLHGQVHNQAGADDRFAGLLAWQAFDYDSMHGLIDHRLKCNGVGDTFRVPKLGASIYQSQVDPRVRPVIAPNFYWDLGTRSPADGPGKTAMICSNCDRLEVFVGGEHRATVRPDVEGFGHLPYPPSFADLAIDEATKAELPDLVIEGYVGNDRVLIRRFASNPSGDRLSVVADDAELVADGSDATRVVFRSVDKYGAPRPYAGGEVQLALSGPGELVGDNPFAFGDNGGVGAVWIRTKAGAPGAISLTATHPTLGAGSVDIRSVG